MLGMYQPGYICIVEDINMEELPEGFLKQAAAVPADHCRDRQLSCHHVGPSFRGITLGGSFMAFLKKNWCLMIITTLLFLLVYTIYTSSIPLPDCGESR